MYGEYSIPMTVEMEGLHVAVRKEGAGALYTRDCLGEKVEKRLMPGNEKILLNPVEPLNKPKGLTPHLQVEFEKTMVVAPRLSTKIFITFPVEIGVYISANDQFHIVDVFTFTRPKFTIYGDPRNGVLCKHWKSAVHSSIPSTDPLREGVVELDISNSLSDWIEITRSVFNAYGMKLYYNDHSVLQVRALSGI